MTCRAHPIGNEEHRVHANVKGLPHKPLAKLVVSESHFPEGINTTPTLEYCTSKGQYRVLKDHLPLDGLTEGLGDDIVMWGAHMKK